MSGRCIDDVVDVDYKPDVVDLVALGFGLDPRFEVVGMGFTGANALRPAETLHPVALIIDSDMAVNSGQEAISLVRTASPETRIVVLTGTREHLISAAEPTRTSPLEESLLRPPGMWNIDARRLYKAAGGLRANWAGSLRTSHEQRATV